VVGPGLEAPVPVADVGLAAEHEDGDGPGRGLALQEAAGHVAVHPGHQHVENDEVDLPGEGGLDGLEAVAHGNDLVPRLAQESLEHAADEKAVVGDDHPAHRFTCFPIIPDPPGSFGVGFGP